MQGGGGASACALSGQVLAQQPIVAPAKVVWHVKIENTSSNVNTAVGIVVQPPSAVRRRLCAGSAVAGLRCLQRLALCGECVSVLYAIALV